MPNNNIKVSVVIPTYKVEQYIERCVRSLFEQTLDSIEYIFVDDCSPDNSIAIMQKVLEEYPYRKEQVKIIRHEVNQGVEAARNHGVAACTGDYIIHCDSDDWVDLNMYESMYKKAVESNADMVYCDFIIDGGNKQKKLKFKTITNAKEFFFYMCANQCYVSSCNKLYKRDIPQKNVQYSLDHVMMNEDFVYNIHCFNDVHTIAHVKGCYYHYFSNFESVSKQKWKRCHFENILDVYKLITNTVNKGCYSSKCKNAYEQVILFLLLRHPEITTKVEFSKYKKLFFTSLLIWTPMSIGRKIALWLGMINYQIPTLLLKIKQR